MDPSPDLPLYEPQKGLQRLGMARSEFRRRGDRHLETQHIDIEGPGWHGDAGANVGAF
jgi:hypothetical protein